ncbi:DUF4232 domain-containing protein [Actinospica sp. MGRD01-02]|uniref:DUF4232 domain-containing protein n=1 Tax=Actinospica acidithermotolerans TaxID=2828514 RepID=A0A941EHA8_9ACTN|nr:DUF4232 domain-containing protein [Actinospica acidithermotolerans]MBR7829074.1 DUF4232 domain-containing protein [Actinospica acidithermotolerans]
MKQVISALGVAAGTLVLCTACVGGSSGGGNAASTASGSHPAATAGTGGAGTAAAASATPANATGTAGGTSTAGSGSGGSGSSGVATCSARYLNGSVSGEQGTAGSIYVDIVFKNLNNEPCTMYGYPGVSFGAGTPVQQVGQPAARSPQVTPSLVTLQPGGHAYAVLQIGDAANWPPTTCQPTPTTYLQVYPPNTSNLLYIAFDSTACKGDVVTLHVEAVRPGTGS